MKLKELQTIDAEELASQPLPPPSFIVDGLIPYGLCVLAGPSKCGKSWLMLWLCMRVSQGLPIWERKTQQCDVLYLCLEDTYARIQRRMYRLNEESVPELRLGVISEKLHCGLEEQIEQHLSKYPNTKLVVIDTLQKVRKPNSADSNMYAADYEDISALKRIADQRSIAIVLVHHLRKLKDSSDPFNELSGSTGLMGALEVAGSNSAGDTPSSLATIPFTSLEQVCPWQSPIPVRRYLRISVSVHIPSCTAFLISPLVISSHLHTSMSSSGAGMKSPISLFLSFTEFILHLRFTSHSP